MQLRLITMLLATLAAGIFGGRLPAAPQNPNTDWFQKAGYGVFVHYLQDIQNNPAQVQSLGKQTDWDACVKEFDTARFAQAMHEAGAGYVIFTMHQRTRFLIAPNATFDRLAGYRPGEACSTRDLVADLYTALQKHRIPLMLYWTGDGPRSDAQAAKAMGWADPVPVEYVKKWASVAREYGERYGDKVAGWWVDGSYPFIGYNEEKLGLMAEALKAGNPRRIIALNPGVEEKVKPYSRHEDYTCGEQNRFLDKPLTRWIGGEQWHILSYLGADKSGNYLGAGWGQPGVRYGKEELAEYIADVNLAGGVVSVDVLLYRDGALDRSQLEVLKSLRPALAKLKSTDPVPPGNLAFRKPARLLSLDGTHELIVNGGGARDHSAKCGVDGRANTDAMAAGEWPWTYEVDLLEIRNLKRMKATFARDAFPTKVRVQVSADRKQWQTVAEADNLNGQPYTCEFSPARAQYFRLSAVKPDGPNQKGGQMSVAELEVYE